MERIKVNPYIRFAPKKEGDDWKSRLYKLLSGVTISAAVRSFAAFFIARTSIYGDIAPFGVAFYVAAFKGKIPALTLAFIILGYISAGIGIKGCIKNILSMLLFSAVALPAWKNVQKLTIYRALLLCGAILASGAMVMLSKGMLSYYLIVSAFEAILSFGAVFAIEKGLFVLEAPSRSLRFSDGELLALAASAGLVLSGMADLVQIGGVSLSGIACVLLVLIIAHKLPLAASCAAGIAIGLVAGLGSYNVSEMVAVYGLGGLMCGILSHFGKGGISIGFILANALLSLYSGENHILVNMYECIGAILIFAFMPPLAFDWMDKFSAASRRKNYAMKVREQTSRRLRNFGESFAALSKTFTDLTESKKTTNISETAQLINKVAQRVCKECGLKNYCWKKEFNTTWNQMYKMIAASSENGSFSKKDMPRDFENNCLKSEEISVAFSSMYELHRTDLLWEARVEESRAIIAKQMDGVSRLLNNLARDTQSNLLIDEDMEDKLYEALSRRGVRIREISAGYNMAGRLEITVSTEGCGGIFRCDRQIAPVLSQITGCAMERSGLRRCEDCTIRYTQAGNWSVEPGCAASAAEGKISGDSFSFARLDDGNFVVALSDGMGTGEEAAKESHAVVSLVGKLLSAGFDKNITVDLINSILVSKSCSESFATIDLGLLDMEKGICEFIKIGAAVSFIKRKSGKVECIRNTSLPAGVLENIEIENRTKQLEDGDMLIMVSDGILDADTKHVKKEEWVKNALGSFRGDDPQRLAEFLLSCAQKLAGKGNRDDMTVLTLRLTENVFKDRGYKIEKVGQE